MRSISRKFQVSFIVAVFAIAGLASCSKDNEAEVIVPQIVAPGLKDGKDTIYIGDSRVLSPQLAEVKNPTFLWLVNGVQVSTDSTYTFTAAERGDYTISYKIISGNALATYYYRIKVLGKFENGFFLVNEGQYGKENGDVNFYRNGEDSVYQYVFKRNNPGKQLGQTTDYGAIYKNKLYLVSKQGAFVVADPGTMKETGRIDQLPAFANSFCGVNSSTGLIGTADGVYPVNLQTLALGTKLAGVTGQVGGMVAAEGYIIVMSETQGMVALNNTDLSVAKILGPADVGFTRTPDGTVWAARNNMLFAINANNLKMDTVTVPFPVYGAWGAWNAGMLSASTIENAVFIGKTNAWGAGGREVYKYAVGNPNSLNAPFVTIPAGREMYGAGVRYNPGNNTIVVTDVKSGYGDNYKDNTLYIYDASSGSLKKSVNFMGFFFPAMPLFN
ncbi:PKD-like domain-containing protein [Chitinophaga ginsengisegetis]|uniref:PKD-like domain-containing protein n=1 Tax=Chitinophaga ginsengisegetis TaxID=393003 RepID=A0A1T5P553_9BACT|nr:DUF5074 domain-containing protein [Chitinophaga ginsengisegetis]MDR6570387.1 hypothetical protein [Chitinophaga ginsengisegetis]MDR6650121.1 hypothetical protein [Chitinophaga ginsengisegetis]MDR6656238.1 hypothetical protein [Chitinophaga ginsengisegetis]SKD07835.1 PKD-like domain-containing protein [Chitinophaga ginsengisegetis]